MQRWGKETQAAKFAECHCEVWRQLLCEQCGALGSALAKMKPLCRKHNVWEGIKIADLLLLSREAVLICRT